MSKLDDLLKRSRALNRLNSFSADEPCWGPIDDVMYSRYDLMDLLVHMVASGYSVPDALVELEHKDGVSPASVLMPQVATINAWKSYHPDFAHALAEAELSRGELLGESALQLVERLPMAPSRGELERAKLVAEMRSKAAARLNQRYQDKHITQRLDSDASLSLDAMQQRLAALLKSNPGLATALASELGGAKGTLMVSSEEADDE
jgi:hypothetical protein